MEAQSVTDATFEDLVVTIVSSLVFLAIVGAFGAVAGLLLADLRGRWDSRRGG